MGHQPVAAAEMCACRRYKHGIQTEAGQVYGDKPQGYPRVSLRGPRQTQGWWRPFVFVEGNFLPRQPSLSTAALTPTLPLPISSSAAAAVPGSILPQWIAGGVRWAGRSV